MIYNPQVCAHTNSWVLHFESNCTRVCVLHKLIIIYYSTNFPIICWIHTEEIKTYMSYILIKAILIVQEIDPDKSFHLK